MKKIVIPCNYQSVLSLYETQSAIGFVKDSFSRKLGTVLNLKRVPAPLFVRPETGLNDDLDGVERPVCFNIPEIKTDVQIVQSLAKWKRMALYNYGFKVGEGLYTDMIAVRRDEEISNIHSIYVDQWDWEKVITMSTRNAEYLKGTVTAIVDAICDTYEELKQQYPQLSVSLSRNVKFVTTQELEDTYPLLTPKEREDVCVKQYKTVFVMRIGDVLKSGEKHEERAPDYDDWSLNGDILFWNELLNCSFEISSMGIRVDSKSLDEQLTKSNCDNRRDLPFHQMVLNNKLPLSIGGGIGQSRLCMLMLGKAHIGEVQVSVWDSETIEACREANVYLL